MRCKWICQQMNPSQHLFKAMVHVEWRLSQLWNMSCFVMILMTSSTQMIDQTMNLTLHLSLLHHLLLQLMHKLFLPMHLLLTSLYIWALQKITHASKSLCFVPTLTTTNVHVFNALKITKCSRRSTSYLINIDFDNIVMKGCQVHAVYVRWGRRFFFRQ